ncbi:MAG: hypothetical protein LBP95_12905 [Deltaproteobacteria bacterium]|jgi:predicted transcriptional regulator of viral defense system|nr:hypothetical protein [Deltaproteobacteria bacterium]
MELEDFLSAKPVFTKRDVDQYLDDAQPPGCWSRVTFVSRLRRAGRAIMVRRGLFVSVPGGVSPEAHDVDHYCVLASLTSDAVITHRSALEYHGLVEPDADELTYSAVRPLTQVSFRGKLYKGVKFPKSLIRSGRQHLLAVGSERLGQSLLVSTLERTLVDIMDRPDLAGGWGPAGELLESVKSLDLDAVVDYVKALGNSTTAAKVGYYLAGRVSDLGVAPRHLAELAALRPNQPHYLDRSRRRGGRLVQAWNLMVRRDEERPAGQVFPPSA